MPVNRLDPEAMRLALIVVHATKNRESAATLLNQARRLPGAKGAPARQQVDRLQTTRLAGAIRSPEIISLVMEIENDVRQTAHPIDSQVLETHSARIVGSARLRASWA
jgi:hypothetical protein